MFWFAGELWCWFVLFRLVLIVLRIWLVVMLEFCGGVSGRLIVLCSRLEWVLMLASGFVTGSL